MFNSQIPFSLLHRLSESSVYGISPSTTAHAFYAIQVLQVPLLHQHFLWSTSFYVHRTSVRLTFRACYVDAAIVVSPTWFEINTWKQIMTPFSRRSILRYIAAYYILYYSTCTSRIVLLMFRTLISESPFLWLATPTPLCRQTRQIIQWENRTEICSLSLTIGTTVVVIFPVILSYALRKVFVNNCFSDPKFHFFKLKIHKTRTWKVEDILMSSTFMFV